MRRSTLLFLCSLGPGGVLAACLSSSGSSPGPDDAGVFGLGDAGLPLYDASGSFTPDANDASPAADAEDSAPAVDASPVVDAPADATPAGTFSTSPIDFGLVSCGTAPASTKTYAFQNTGPSAITYSAKVGGAAGTATLFSIKGASAGTVAPGATGSITIATAAVPVTSTAGTPITATLTLTTDVPGFTTVNVPLALTPQGGSLTLSPAPAAFNQVQLTVQAPDIPLTITNVGNAPVALTLGAPTDNEFAVVYTGAPSAATLAPGATLPGAAARFKPATAGARSATAAIQTSSVLCASPAASVAMSGTGTTAPVTVAPGLVSFGLVSCGTQSTQVSPITITNGYGFAVNYTTSLAAGPSSPYTLDVPAGSVPANGKAVINVSALKVPAKASVAAGGFDDNLTVTVNAPGVTPSVIALQETAQGAILGLTMANTGFGNVQAGQTGSLPFTVTNSGNIAAPLTLTPSGAGFAAAFTATSTAAAGGTAGGNATFNPPGPGGTGGSLAVGTTAVVCSPLPPPVSLSATGVGPVATFAATPLALGVTCGGTASAPVSLTVTNNTAYTLTLTASSQNGSFSVLTPSVSIPASSKGVIQIQLPAVAIGAMAAGSSTDNLLFTTNEFGAPTHSVPVDLTVTGANLSFSGASTFTFNSCPAQSTYTIQNTGNADATVTAPANTLNVGFDFATQQGVAVTAGQTVTGSVRPISQASPSCVGTQNFTFAASGPVCQSTLQMQVDYNIPVGGGCNAGPCC
jgi:hypothetical protein